jgi:hypothetical protein
MHDIFNRKNVLRFKNCQQKNLKYYKNPNVQIMYITF